MAIFRESKARAELVKLLKGVGVEVGVQEGRFSHEILSNPAVTKLYMIDAWREFPAYDDIANVSDPIHEMRMLTAVQNTSDFKESRCIINEPSIQAASIFPDMFFDFIYLDANHCYRETLRDIRAWFPKLKTTGIICGDDYLTEKNQFADFGVKKAVDEYFGEEVKTIEIEGEMIQWLINT